MTYQQPGGPNPPVGQNPVGGPPSQGFPQQQPGTPMDLAKILHFCVAGLALLILGFSFASSLSSSLSNASGPSVYANFSANISFFFAAGLASLLVLTPAEKTKPGPFPAIFALAGAFPFLIGYLASATGPINTAFGGVLVMILGILQALVAIAAYLFDLGVLKAPAPRPAYQPQAWGPPSGGFPQPGQYGQPQQFGQPGHYGQPGQFGQQPPASQQQTQYLPQPGQYGQPQAQQPNQPNQPEQQFGHGDQQYGQQPPQQGNSPQA